MPCSMEVENLWQTSFMLTFALLSWRFPLYQVIMAFGLEPLLSQCTSYLRSATKGVDGFIIFTVNGFTRII